RQVSDGRIMGIDAFRENGWLVKEEIRYKVWEWNKATKPINLPAAQDPLYVSPDGNLLAAASGKHVKLWDLKTGRELATLESVVSPSVPLEFSPDGTRLVLVSNQEVLPSQRVPSLAGEVWDVSARPPRRVGTLDLSEAPYPKFSPNGKW